MKKALSTIAQYANFAYKTAKITAKSLIKTMKQNIKPENKFFFKIFRSFIQTLIDGVWYYTRPNKAGDGVQRAESNVRVNLARKDWDKYSSEDKQIQELERSEQFEMQSDIFGQDYVSEQMKQNAQNRNAPRYDRASRIPIILEWKPIPMTVKQYNDLRKLSYDTFRQMAKNYVSPTTFEILREPCSMRCCRNIKEKKERYQEQKILKQQIENTGRCLLCFQEAKEEDIHFQQDIYVYIHGLRSFLLATYLGLDDMERRIWKGLIEESFGVGYVEQHLENVPLIQKGSK